MFCKKSVLRDFAKFTEKHLCQSLFFNKVAGLSPQACNFIKKETLARYFPVNFAKLIKTPFFIEHLWLLLLNLLYSLHDINFLLALDRKSHKDEIANLIQRIFMNRYHKNTDQFVDLTFTKKSKVRTP